MGVPPGFARFCPFSPEAMDEDRLGRALFPGAPRRHASTGRFVAAYVGCAAEEGYRERGSSGGMASWTAAELLRLGKIDGLAHVVPAEGWGRERRFFEYRISRTAGEIRAGAQSRYYPVELSRVLREIWKTPGRYALTGVPCFIKAVQLLRRRDAVLRRRIPYALGLFCGHMKSSRLVESFAWQMGVHLGDIRRIVFRSKDPGREARVYVARLTLADGRTVEKEWSAMVDGDWGAGFFQNPACDWCDDVTAETADISFGDAWIEPYASDARGTNVVVVRSPELHGLLEQARKEGRLCLEPVGADVVARTQEAGLRQRRQGLAYRLSWRKRGLQPRKRVAPNRGLPLRRKLIYRLRHAIAAGSNVFFHASRRLGLPGMYLAWARSAYGIYEAVAYHRGRLGSWCKGWGI
jgi:coenzyme F420-reducing hydrogenase beta subunit